jgi:hypothetical protein
VPRGDVWTYTVTAERAIYVADQEIDGQWGLYSVLLPSGGAPLRLGALQAFAPPNDLAPEHAPRTSRAPTRSGW